MSDFLEKSPKSAINKIVEMPAILFDDVFEYIGEFEMYQLMLYLLLGITCFYPGYEVMALSFIGASPDYWCKVRHNSSMTPLCTM